MIHRDSYMEDLNKLLSELSLDITDNEEKCKYAIKTKDAELMYKIAEDLKLNYVLDFNVYPCIIQSHIQEINKFVDCILEKKYNIEETFNKLYYNICFIYDVLQNQKR